MKSFFCRSTESFEILSIYLRHRISKNEFLIKSAPTTMSVTWCPDHLQKVPNIYMSLIDYFNSLIDVYFY